MGKFAVFLLVYNMMRLNHICLSCEQISSSAIQPTIGTKGKEIIHKRSQFQLNEECNQETKFSYTCLHNKSSGNKKKRRYSLSTDIKYDLMNLRGGGFTLPSINPTIAMSSLGATSQLLFAIGLGAVAASQPNLLDASKLFYFCCM